MEDSIPSMNIQNIQTKFTFDRLAWKIKMAKMLVLYNIDALVHRFCVD